MESVPENSIESVRESLRDRLLNLSKTLESQNKLHLYFDEIKKKSDAWEEKYGKKVKQYNLYHILVGSSPDYTPGERLGEDFPDEDNVLNFIESLEDKYL